MLEERGERRPDQTDCTADLSITASIDPEYVENGEQRMDLYRRMAAIRSREDADELLDEIVDRYGDPPKGVLNLIDVALMRTRATAAGITDVSQSQRAVCFTLARFDPETVAAVCARPEIKKTRRFERLRRQAGAHGSPAEGGGPPEACQGRCGAVCGGNRKMTAEATIDTKEKQKNHKIRVEL